MMSELESISKELFCFADSGLVYSELQVQSLQLVGKSTHVKNESPLENEPKITMRTSL